MQSTLIGPYRVFYTDPEAFRCVLAHGLNYESHVRDELKLALESSRLFLDIGSNVGLHTVAAKIWRGPDFPTVSIDVNPANCELLCRTILENGFSNSIVLSIAASDRVQVLHGNRNWNTGLADRIVDPEFDALYMGIPLDLFDVGHVDTVKIDVEGFELAVLRGMINTILDTKPTIFFEFNLHCLKIVGVDPVDLLEFPLKLGYELTVLDYKQGMRAVFNNAALCRDYIAQFGEICDIMARPKRN